LTEHKVGTREEWLAARRGLLEREKELTRLNDELACERRELPWVPVEKEYRFETDEGTKTLAELFDGRSQLLVYHLMFGPEWTAACPGCSALADHLDRALVHLNARDVTMICISHAPHEKVQAYRRRMGWTFPYVSSFGSDFNFDFGVSFTEEQRRDNDAEYNFERVDFAKVLEDFAGSDSMADAAASCGTDLAGYVTTEGPGLSAFVLSDGVVYHTYSSYAPEINFMVFFGQLLERAPKGGDDSVATLRHDEYEGAAGTTPTSVQPRTASRRSHPRRAP
jgi:predicted dithiol-disulfide oxidoreductase (DUF899 family)